MKRLNIFNLIYMKYPKKQIYKHKKQISGHLRPRSEHTCRQASKVWGTEKCVLRLVCVVAQLYTFTSNHWMVRALTMCDGQNKDPPKRYLLSYPPSLGHVTSHGKKDHAAATERRRGHDPKLARGVQRVTHVLSSGRGEQPMHSERGSKSHLPFGLQRWSEDPQGKDWDSCRKLGRTLSQQGAWFPPA